MDNINLEEKSPLRFLEDDRGNHSSKRLVGTVLVSTSILLGLILFGLSVSKQDSLTSLKVIEFFLFAGCGLLGIGVAEGIFKK